MKPWGVFPLEPNRTPCRGTVRGLGGLKGGCETLPYLFFLESLCLTRGFPEGVSCLWELKTLSSHACFPSLAGLLYLGFLLRVCMCAA